MTRQEFLEESQQWSWGDLICFCGDVGCSLCEDIYSEDDRDDWVDDHLEDLARNDDWRNIRDYLCGIPTGDDYYERGDYDDWYSLDDIALEERIGDVRDWMDRNDYWDEEDDEDEDEEESLFTEDDEDTTPIEDEEISISELLAACNSGLKSIDEERTKQEEAFKESFVEFVAEVKVQATVERG